MIKTNIVIIGAGAAGLMCAITAAKRGRKVIVLDHAQKLGLKILISGGGRCNFTNLHTTPNDYFSQNPHFCKSALSQYPPHNFITLVEKHQIAYHEKEAGQLFCDHSSKEIVEMLKKECDDSGVDIRLNTKVKEIEKKNDEFLVTTESRLFTSPNLVMATGGLSFPNLGATSFGYEIARQFGHKIIPTVPALDGFVFGPDEQKRFSGLSGVSVKAKVSVNKKNFEGGLLFTHVGLSGPAILNASLYWQPKEPVTIEWVSYLPKRLTQIYANTEEPLRFIPARTVGFNKAEVTKGGVSTDEISSKTMESKRVKGLYFIGEVLDVTGRLGGFNFQWAWASGFAAGSNI